MAISFLNSGEQNENAMICLGWHKGNMKSKVGFMKFSQKTPLQSSIISQLELEFDFNERSHDVLPSSI